MRIENLEWAQWLDQVFTRHDYDLSIVAHAEPMDYDIYARDDYYFGYSSAAFKALIADLDDSIDPKTRSDLLERIQRKITDDSVNGFLFQYPRLAVWSAHLQGIGFDNLLGTVDLKDARFDAAGSAAKAQSGRAKGIAARVLRWLALAGGALLMILAARRFGAFFVGARLAVLLATLVAATAVVFIAVQVVPGDPVRYMMGLQADAQNVAAMRHQLGLDAPAIERYLHWVAGLLRGDFGTSYTYRVPVGTLIAERLQVSLPLAVFSSVLAAAVAFPVGFAAASRRGRASDAALTAFTQLGLAVPNFWLGMLLVILMTPLHHPQPGFLKQIFRQFPIARKINQVTQQTVLILLYQTVQQSGSRPRSPRAIALASVSIAFAKQHAMAFILPGYTRQHPQKMHDPEKETFFPIEGLR